LAWRRDSFSYWAIWQNESVIARCGKRKSHAFWDTYFLRKLPNDKMSLGDRQDLAIEESLYVTLI
jgi:hypothetical protein